MNDLNPLDILFRWAHVGTAIVLLGGAVFMRFVLMPAADTLDDNTYDGLRSQVIGRWKRFVHIGILLLLVSGFYNYLVVMIPKHKGDGLYHALLGTKILLALGIFFLASALVGRSAKFETLRAHRGKWMLVVVLLGAVIVGISGFLKVRPIPATAPESTETSSVTNRDAVLFVA
jgi:uncharacterized membrane protein